MARPTRSKGQNGAIAATNDDALDDPPFEDVDPERLAECAYWRCGELFETRSSRHIFCRKACRSRQHKWERAEARKERRRR